MTSKLDDWLRQPLLSEQVPSANRTARTLLFLAWLAVTLWLAAVHVPWRDEARAWSLTLMGSNWPDMFRAVQGEGHPFLWYVLLRAGHDLFGSPEVLQVTAVVIGVAAVALLVFRGPFRLALLAALIFSLHLGFEYTVVARNYGISALLMLAIAASWQRIRDSLWLGVLLLLLCNTNVPSVFLAGSLFLYRMLELWGEQGLGLKAPEWRRWLLNAVLLGIGAILCFVAVYPPANDAAASTAAVPIGLRSLVNALFTADRSFIVIGFGVGSPFGALIVLLSLLVFLDRPWALLSALVALVLLKLFFHFVYPGFYRHSSLFFILLVALAWMEADKGWLKDWKARGPRLVMLVGTTAFFLLMAMQVVRYVREPIADLLAGRPYSHAADLAAILNRPDLQGAQLMIDPDSMGESVSFQTGRPFWLIRQDRPGTITPFSKSGNKNLTLDRLLQQAANVHARTGRPVVIALEMPLATTPAGSYDMMYGDYTRITPDSVARFRAATRKIASYRESGSGEDYDVYVYPAGQASNAR